MDAISVKTWIKLIESKISDELKLDFEQDLEKTREVAFLKLKTIGEVKQAFFNYNRDVEIVFRGDRTVQKLKPNEMEEKTGFRFFNFIPKGEFKLREREMNGFSMVGGKGWTWTRPHMDGPGTWGTGKLFGTNVKKFWVVFNADISQKAAANVLNGKQYQDLDHDLKLLYEKFDGKFHIIVQYVGETMFVPCGSVHGVLTLAPDESFHFLLGIDHALVVSPWYKFYKHHYRGYI